MPITKQRRNFEAKFTTKLQLWLKHNAKKINHNQFLNFGPIEAKVSYERRFNLKSNIKKHQLKGLMAIREGQTVVYKISDMDRMRKPWDIDCYTSSFPAFALMWYRGGNRTFYLIDALKFKVLMDDGTASITEEEAEEMAITVGHLIGK